MASSRQLKNRIRSTKNIGQITKAMEAVSAVKMRKSELVALRSRPFSFAALDILQNTLSKIDLGELHENPFLNQREIKKICLIVVTSDKGLAGAFNTNVLRKAQKFIDEAKAPVDVIAVGKKGKDYFGPTKLGRAKATLIAEFLKAGDFTEAEETLPISNLIYELYNKGVYQEVLIIYTNFISALKQDVIIRKLIPFTLEAIRDVISNIIPREGKYSHIRNSFEEDKKSGSKYLLEPNVNEVLHDLLPFLIDIEVHTAILEANASEHSSRMIAMKNASQNAIDIANRLRITYNKTRQAQITKELIEITAGTEALSK
ncbi:MAG: ATP synthase F1 subunit gamma [Patescibacteria group bacterium]